MNHSPRTMHQTRAKRFAGFTLIELLVVVAIIAILASLLLPGLSRAKRKTEMAACLSNFKQLQLSLHMYVEDNNGRFPDNHGVFPLPDRRWRPVWAALGMRYENDDLTTFEPSDATNSTALRDPELSTLSPYYQTPDILKCPADKSYIVINGSRHSRVRSYSMSCFFRPRAITWWGRYLFANLQSTAVTTPANTWVFTDEHEDTIDDSSFTIMPEDYFDWIGLPSTRHGRSTPFSFLDGHCEPHRWVEPNTFVPVQRKRRGNTPAPPTDRDTLWIRNFGSPLLVL